MGTYFRGVLIFMGCLFSWGANKHMQYSGSAQLCGNGLSVYILGLKVLFVLPEIQSAID